tara:strand:+ start:299 stop:544 length:246 start_codon:yes stop_codon:yes gene_type:complete
MSRFAANIRLLRIYKGWSQTELAAKVEVDKSLVAHWEAGRRKPTIDGALLLGKIFDTTVENLFEGNAKESTFFLATQAQNN